MMKRVCITGLNSYIGTALQEHLRTMPELYEVESVSVRTCALGAIDFRGFDAIVHLAAVVHQKESAANRRLFDEVNRDLTAAIAKKAKAEGVRQFIFMSTMSVYGMETGEITKDTIPAPQTAYGRSKLEAERLIAPLADDTFFVTIIRSPMVFGKGAKGNYRRLEALAKRLRICPALENKRSMTSINTLCGMLKTCLDEPRSEIVFPQEAQPVKTKDLIAQIAQEQGKTLRETRLFDPAIRMLRVLTRSGKKAFGDLVYQDLDTLPLSAVFMKEERP